VYDPVAEAAPDHLGRRVDVGADEPARRLTDETERAEEREPIVRGPPVRKSTAITESSTAVVGVAGDERDGPLVCVERVEVGRRLSNASSVSPTV
jgi:hypothetical protein